MNRHNPDVEVVLSEMQVGIVVNEDGMPEVYLELPGEASIFIPAYMAGNIGASLIEAGMKAATAAALTAAYREVKRPDASGPVLDQVFKRVEQYLHREGGK